MLCLGVIEESDSPKNNSITLVRKPGKNRLCLDSRKLNQRNVKDEYPQQNIEGILSRINKTKFLSSVDLKHALCKAAGDIQPLSCLDTLCITLLWCLSASPTPLSAFVD